MTVGSLGGYSQSLTFSVALARALEPAPCRFSTQELVDMLNRPLCVGSSRRVILDQLENRYYRTFADVWDFVRFAQEQDLKEQDRELQFDVPLHYAELTRGRSQREGSKRH
jgi:hypothetical protein